MGVSDCGAKRESRNGIWQLVRIEVEYDGCNFQQRGHWRDGHFLPSDLSSIRPVRPP
jgi:hypothetical protein